MKALYKNLEIREYWNGFRVYYRHPDNSLELIAYQMTKKDALQAGKQQVDFINGKKEGAEK